MVLKRDKKDRTPASDTGKQLHTQQLAGVGDPYSDYNKEDLHKRQKAR